VQGFLTSFVSFTPWRINKGRFIPILLVTDSVSGLKNFRPLFFSNTLCRIYAKCILFSNGSSLPNKNASTTFLQVPNTNELLIKVQVLWILNWMLKWRSGAKPQAAEGQWRSGGGAPSADDFHNFSIKMKHFST